MASQMGKAQWHTPLEIMKNQEEMNKRLEDTKLPLEQVPDEELTFFNNKKAEKRLQGYDQYFAFSKVFPIYNPRKEADNRFYKPCLWEHIFYQDKDRPIPITTAHWYGRPCRVQYDFPEKIHNRTGQISTFYRKSGVLPVEEREVL